MKNFKLVVAAVSLFVFAVSPAFAGSASTVTEDQNINPITFTWPELREFVHGCVIQPVSNQQIGKAKTLPLVSICPQSLVVHGSVAQFKIKDATFVASLIESPLADEGDLNILLIRDSKGTLVAQAEHVAAFGDILLALAGGNDQFRQISVDPRAE